MVCAVGWVAFEWLFHVTKISFMSLYTATEMLNVLSSGALLVALGLLLISIPFFLVGILLGILFKQPLLRCWTMFLPVILLLSMVLLVLIDNFSLTVLGWGVRDSAGLGVWIYRAFNVALLLLVARWICRFLARPVYTATDKAITLGAVLIIASALPLMLITGSLWSGRDMELSVVSGDPPNIVILSGDGIAANHMSLYGYERPTTPFMDSVRDEFLVAENSFTNASDTGGAVVSLLTGKLPTTTRVIYPPDTLRGADSFEHLPALLKKIGYYNVDISMRHYADPFDLNMRGGFSEANFRKLKHEGGTLVSAIRSVPAFVHASQLIDRISERVSERFDHIWRGKPMSDPLAEVNRPDLRWIRDPDRMKELERVIREAPSPFFIHVHMMGTHGERFKPTIRVYSTEEDYHTLWSIDGYDDAIMDFDRNVEATYQLLDELEILDSTLLIVTSDHGFSHRAVERLPMLMRLPGKTHSGMLGGNTERLDIAPTILHVLGLPKQEWMEGASMLTDGSGSPASRDIFATGSRSEKTADGNFWSVSKVEPPWYSLGRLFLIHCDQGFTLNVDTLEVVEQEVVGSNAHCDERISPEEARARLYRHLEEKAYTVPREPHGKQGMPTSDNAGEKR